MEYCFGRFKTKGEKSIIWDGLPIGFSDGFSKLDFCNSRGCGIVNSLKSSPKSPVIIVVVILSIYRTPEVGIASKVPNADRLLAEAPVPPCSLGISRAAGTSSALHSTVDNNTPNTQTPQIPARIMASFTAISSRPSAAAAAAASQASAKRATQSIPEVEQAFAEQPDLKKRVYSAIGMSFPLTRLCQRTSCRILQMELQS